MHYDYVTIILLTLVLAAVFWRRLPAMGVK